MTLKNKLLFTTLVVIVALSGGWLILNNQKYKNKTSICGPKSMGLNYDISNCNKSCLKDDDCEFSCGCEAINKQETCHDEGIIYDCAYTKPECSIGRCIIKENK